MNNTFIMNYENASKQLCICAFVHLLKEPLISVSSTFHRYLNFFPLNVRWTFRPLYAGAKTKWDINFLNCTKWDQKSKDTMKFAIFPNHKISVPIIDLRGAEQFVATVQEEENVVNTVPDLAIIPETGNSSSYYHQRLANLKLDWIGFIAKRKRSLSLYVYPPKYGIITGVYTYKVRGGYLFKKKKNKTQTIRLFNFISLSVFTNKSYVQFWNFRWWGF